MNRLTLFFVISIIGILLGWGIGGYITYNNTIEAVGKIPASPIVVKAVYDRPTHSVIFSVLNPGTLPLTVKKQSIRFTPGKSSGEKEYQIQDIPVNVPLIPLGITTVAVKLKKGSQELKTGDIVDITLEYVHPLSTDRYYVKHGYTHTGKPQETPPLEYRKEDKK
ncbi:hypothetical protein [Persephonella sp.]